MMTSLDDKKQKRNKPCEHCRSQRRRCMPTESSQCERCIKKRLSCIYKLTVKPILAKNTISTSKRLRVMDQVQDIEESLGNLEHDVQQILSSSTSSNKQQQLQDPSSLNAVTAENGKTQQSHPRISTFIQQQQQQDHSTTQQRPTWTVTLQPSEAGIQLETSISSMADLVQFLAKGIGYISNPPQRSPNYYSNNAQQTMMVVTNKMLQVEQTLRQVFGKFSTNENQHNDNMVATTTTTSEIGMIYSNDFIRRATVLHLVNSHFHCVRSMTPVVASYYLPMISKQPDSTVAYALAGFMALSSCVVHVNDKLIPFNRSDFGKYLYHCASAKLRDDLFDAHPSLETVMALLTMTRSSMILLRNSDTQLYLHLAWRMILALRDEYIPFLRQYQQCQSNITFTTTPELARAESWKRLFYGVRYLVIHVQIIQDNSVDFSTLLSESDIGYPLPLPCEIEDPPRKRIIETFGYYVRMDDCHISSNVDTIGYQLFAGVLDEASLSEISFMEHRLFSYWQGLPPGYHLASTPMEYLDSAMVISCKDQHILRLNQLFYSHWLSLEIRFMQSPSDADLKDTTLDRMDSGRALLLVSICGDALAHLFYALYQRETCTLDLHWLLITTEALQLLTKTANIDVRKRAERNLQMCLPVMMAQMKAKHDSPPSSSSASTTLFTMPPQSPLSSSVVSQSLPTYSNNVPSSPSISTSSLPSIPSPEFFPSGGYQHAHSPGNFSTSTSNGEVDDEWMMEYRLHQSSSSVTVSSDMDTSLAYYGEVKKNLESYFIDGPIDELD